MDIGSDRLKQRRWEFSSRLLIELEGFMRNAASRNNEEKDIRDMFEEDRKRPVEQSLIDLNQTSGVTVSGAERRDILTRLFNIYSVICRGASPNAFDSMRVLQLIHGCKAAKDESHTDSDSSERRSQHRCQYDVRRRDKKGMTALHMACTCSMKQGSFVYRVIERLLQLGADPCATDQDSRPPHLVLSYRLPAEELTPVLGLLFRTGADIHAQNRWGWGIIDECIDAHRIDVLQWMFLHLPHHTSAIDYARMHPSTPGPAGGRPRTIIMIADVAYRAACLDRDMAMASHNDDEGKCRSVRDKCHDIVKLLKSQREKQYTAIRTMLNHHTQLIPDLANIAFSYVESEDS